MMVMIYRILWSALRMDAATKVGLVDVITLEDHKSALADAQATVEALQRELEHAKKMEAVQKEVADNQTWHVRELRAALDDERDRLALDLKKRIWLLHGARMNHLLYGDDGRMDCNVCFREYAGATLEQCYEWEIADACALIAKAALTPAKGVQQHPAFDEYGEHRQPTGLGDL